MLQQAVALWRFGVQHPLLHETLAITWNRILGGGLRFFIVRWALRAELHRAGCTVASAPAALLAFAAVQAMVCGSDANALGALFDAIAMRYWTSPSLSWFRIPSILEIEADLIDPEGPAGGAGAASSGSSRRQRSQSPTGRNAPGAVPPQAPPAAHHHHHHPQDQHHNQQQPAAQLPHPPAAAAADQANDETMVATAGSINLGPADSTMCGGGSPLGLPPDERAGLLKRLAPHLRWARVRAALGIHACVTATIVVGVRRQVTMAFRSLAWGALCNLCLAIEPTTPGPATGATVAHRIDVFAGAVDGWAVLVHLRRCVQFPVSPFPRQMSKTVFHAAAYPAVAQGVVTLLALLWINGGGASQWISTIRRRILRPSYRAWPRLRSPSRRLEALLTAGGPRVLYGLVAAPFAMLKLRVFIAAYLGNPYPSLAAAARCMVTDAGPLATLRTVAGFTIVHVCLGLVNELDVPTRMRRAVLWVLARRKPAVAPEAAAAAATPDAPPAPVADPGMAP